MSFDASDLKRLADPVEVTEDNLVVCGETVGNNCFRFHGIVVCGAPKRVLVLMLLGLEIVESGARISPERAGDSGSGGGRRAMRPPWVKVSGRLCGSVTGLECWWMFHVMG